MYIDGTNFDRDAKVYIGQKQLSINYYYSASRIRVLWLELLLHQEQ